MPKTGLVVLLILLIGTTTKTDEKKVEIQWFRPDGTINWEAEKQQQHIPTDTIVIHHTATTPGIAWKQLSDTEYTRLYVPRFNPTIPDPYIPEGTPVQSGHFRLEKGKKVEVFYAYHWFIRADGRAERLLQDNEVGWHSGNWTMNCRSIAICFDGDFSDVKPTNAALKSCAKLITEYQKKFKIKKIVGHCDVAATKCPGDWWIISGKDELLRLADIKP